MKMTCSMVKDSLLERDKKPRTQKLYTEEDFVNAIAAIKRGLSYRKAALHFGIPKSTLTDRIAGGKSKRQEPIFSAEEEQAFVEYFGNLSRRECGVNSLEIRNTIKCWLDRDNKKVKRFTNNMPTANWVTQFRKRHPSLIIRPLKNQNKCPQPHPQPLQLQTKHESHGHDSTEMNSSMDICSVDSKASACVDTGLLAVSCQDHTVPTFAHVQMHASKTRTSKEEKENDTLGIKARTTSQSLLGILVDRSSPGSSGSSTRDIPECTDCSSDEDGEREYPPTFILKHDSLTVSPSSEVKLECMNENDEEGDLCYNSTCRHQDFHQEDYCNNRTRRESQNGYVDTIRDIDRATSTSIMGSLKNYIPATASPSLPDKENTVGAASPHVTKSRVALKSLEATLTDHEKRIFERRFEEATSLELDSMFLTWKVLKQQCLDDMSHRVEVNNPPSSTMTDANESNKSVNKMPLCCWPKERTKSLAQLTSETQADSICPSNNHTATQSNCCLNYSLMDDNVSPVAVEEEAMEELDALVSKYQSSSTVEGSSSAVDHPADHKNEKY